MWNTTPYFLIILESSNIVWCPFLHIFSWRRVVLLCLNPKQLLRVSFILVVFIFKVFVIHYQTLQLKFLIFLQCCYNGNKWFLYIQSFLVHKKCRKIIRSSISFFNHISFNQNYANKLSAAVWWVVWRHAITIFVSP